MRFILIGWMALSLAGCLEFDELHPVHDAAGDQKSSFDAGLHDAGRHDLRDANVPDLHDATVIADAACTVGNVCTTQSGIANGICVSGVGDMGTGCFPCGGPGMFCCYGGDGGICLGTTGECCVTVAGAAAKICIPHGAPLPGPTSTSPYICINGSLTTSCGNSSQPCCPGNICNNDGGCCVGNRCVANGGLCAKGVTVLGDYLCSAGACKPSVGSGFGCGTSDTTSSSCCSGDPSNNANYCTASQHACVDGGIFTSGVCAKCGEVTQPCCDGNLCLSGGCCVHAGPADLRGKCVIQGGKCSPGMRCFANNCVPEQCVPGCGPNKTYLGASKGCGNQGQAGCGGAYNCPAAYSMSTASGCEACGGKDQPCCPGFRDGGMCSYPWGCYSDNICGTCGDKNHSCCEGRLCFGSTCNVDAGTCH